MKKIIKVLLIVMIYVFMFWGLSRGIGALIHKFNKKEKCICEPTVEVVKEIYALKDEKDTKLLNQKSLDIMLKYKKCFQKIKEEVKT